MNDAQPKVWVQEYFFLKQTIMDSTWINPETTKRVFHIIPKEKLIDGDMGLVLYRRAGEGAPASGGKMILHSLSVVGVK